MGTDLLVRLDEYGDTASRSVAAAVDALGSLTLFVPPTDRRLFARPTLGWSGAPVTVTDVIDLRARQRSFGIPETIEWIDELHPDLEGVAVDAGLAVSRCPILVAAEVPSPRLPLPSRIRVRTLRGAERDLARILAMVDLGMSQPGTAVAPVGVAQRDIARPPGDLEAQRKRLRTGGTVMVVAEDERGPLAAGCYESHGDMCEVTRVATLPAARRQGLGAAVTAALVREARSRGATTVFLRAGDPGVAHVFQRIGFRQVATACVARPA